MLSKIYFLFLLKWIRTKYFLIIATIINTTESITDVSITESSMHLAIYNNTKFSGKLINVPIAVSLIDSTHARWFL